MKKVALFTANTQGGIIQFTLQIYETLKKERNRHEGIFAV